MTRSRIVPAVLFCVCLLGLASCDDAETETGAGPAAPSAAAASAAPVAADDKALCKTVNTAGSTMKTNISNAQRADGSVPPADVKKIFSEFHTTVNEALAGADSKVATAARAVAKEISAAAAAADPIGTAAESDFEQLSTELTAACKAAGTDINF
ncbi:hypothetical protein [Actinoplanes aureus]|uniref:Lipoprotein n=1 Tax=Actinoplanes aureus TaxID=2792083 RepID=A0A931CAK1_9ACTN|nr:hypothetical protein [Actinoplanes aureus]MBG0564407.1 hypothetical protein [Actinoplanes aureus]